MRSSFKLFASALTVFLAGCSTATHVIPAATPVVTANGLHGSLHGGQQPIVGATIQLYAVGTTGDGSAATPLLTPALTTSATGSFDLTGLVTCPSPTTLVYIMASGGNPGLPPPFNNPDSILISALGQCSNPNNIQFINMNEVTTVAAIYALAPFMSSPTAIGSGASDAQALADAFTLAMEYANVQTGITPGTNVPAGVTVPVAQINTLANIISACVNSVGGNPGDQNVCGQLLNLTTPPLGVAPTDVSTALRNLALNPDLNTQAIYNLAIPAAPFQPTLPALPPDFGVRLQVPSDFTVSPSSLSFGSIFVGGVTPGQAISISNNTTHALTTTDIQLTGSNPGDFQIANVCPTPLLPNASCTLQITFSPTAAGGRTAYLAVKNTSPNPYIAIPLSGTGTAGSAGPVNISPSSLDFTLYNTPQTLTVTNNGNSTLNFAGIDFNLQNIIGTPAYTQTNDCSSKIAANAHCTITVVAHSNAADGVTTNLTVRDDATAGPQVVNITYSGTRYMPPDAIDAGDESIGGQEEIDFTVQTPDNAGTVNFALSGTNASEFSFVGNNAVSSIACNYNLSNGTPCTIQLFFNPTTLGPKTATITIPGVGTIPLTGNAISAGVHFTLNPTTVNFSTPVGQPQTQVITVRSTGTVVANLDLPFISGPNAADFTSTTTCTNNAAANSTPCYIYLTYTPSGSGPTTEAGTVNDLTKAESKIFKINTDTPTPSLSVSPNMLTFQNTKAGSTSIPLSVTINAITNNPINASILGVGAFQITSASSCPSTPCQITVVFAPPANASPGTKTGSLAIVDPDSGARASVYLIGTSTAATTLSISPSAYAFPATTVNSQSVEQLFTVTNTGANNVLTITEVSLIGTNMTDFQITTNTCTSVIPGQTCTLGAKFAPQATGARTGAIQIRSNSTTSPDQITLSGTGQ